MGSKTLLAVLASLATGSAIMCFGFFVLGTGSSQYGSQSFAGGLGKLIEGVTIGFVLAIIASPTVFALIAEKNFPGRFLTLIWGLVGGLFGFAVFVLGFFIAARGGVFFGQ